MNFSSFRHVDRPIFRSQMSRKWSQAAWPVPSGNVSESKVLQTVIGLAGAADDVSPINNLSRATRNCGETPRLPRSAPPPHTRVLAACKTLDTPQTSDCPFCWQNIKREKVPHKLSRERDASREPLSRMRAVGVVPPAVRVPAEAVALGLD